MPYWMECVGIWLSGNAAAISAICAVLGVAVAAYGFYYTINEIRLTQKALQAGNTYTIQKDARELANQIFGDDWFSAYLENGKRPPKGKAGEARRRIALMINFYLSVFRQHKADGITQSLVTSMGGDFASFVEHEPAKEYFRERLLDGTYREEHSEMVKYWCPHFASDIISNAAEASK